MLSRIAACAAVIFVWPVCTPISDGDGRLLLPEIVIASDPELTRVAPGTDGEAEKQAPPPESAALVAPAAPLQAADADPPSASLQNAVPSEAEPFGLSAEPVVAGEILSKWGDVEAQIEAENRILARCRSGGSWCPRAARRFLAIVSEGQEQKGRARIGVINRGINLSIVPTPDFVQWGVADRWSTPLETFTTERGDCEDYAIAKYVALSAAGVSQQDIRLVVVRDNAARENHAVVAVRLDGDWVILDNRWLALVRDREMWRVTPLLELDANGVRRFVDPQPTATAQRTSSGAS
jgi:predicted transglutaminase-like cysteine proteinase